MMLHWLKLLAAGVVVSYSSSPFAGCTAGCKGLTRGLYPQAMQCTPLSLTRALLLPVPLALNPPAAGHPAATAA